MEIPYFEKISLEEMDNVRLMNRIDHKYWFNSDLLVEILVSIQPHYKILEIKDKIQQDYITQYYDTEDNLMYLNHHNGKLNRYKVRKRTYKLSGDSFLEIKFKNNKSLTSKRRIVTDCDNENFSLADKQFLLINTPYCANDLHNVLENSFTRLTLVNKNMQERCTIDFNLKMRSDTKSYGFKDLVIVELKIPNKNYQSPLQQVLKNHKILSNGFSKYCIGRSVIDENLKTNAFKAKIKQLEANIYSN